MAKEIELKFLIKDFSWRKHCAKSIDIRQAYLANTNKTSIRVRISDDRAFLNLKSAQSLVERDEYEYEIPLTEGQAILADLCETPQIRKTRHYVPNAGLLWAIDEFHDLNEGLIVAEIELKNRNQVVDKPPWIGTEITAYPQFYNHLLAQHPYSDWSPAERDIVKL